MDNHPAPPHRKTSLPTFSRSVPVEITALPASTRTSFTRVDNTRPSSAAGNNELRDDEAVPSDGSSGARVPPPDAEREEEAVPPVPRVPQVPQTLVQFLLVSGRRRSMAFDPETTVGRVKELAWNTWPSGMFPFPPPSICAAHARLLLLLSRERAPGVPRSVISLFLFFVKVEFCQFD